VPAFEYKHAAAAVTSEAPCPNCGKPAGASADNPFRPFCSERCKFADLGAWFTDRYRIPEDPEPREEDQEKQ